MIGGSSERSLGALSYRIGKKVPLSDIAKTGNYEEDLSRWLDLDLSHVSVIEGDVSALVGECVTETLKRSGGGAEAIDFVVFSGILPSSRHPTRKLVASILRDVGLEKCGRVIAMDNGTAVCPAAMDIANDKLLSGHAKRCLVICVSQIEDPALRFSSDGLTVLSDGVLSFVMGEGAGDFQLAEFARVDHSDWSVSPKAAEEFFEGEYLGVLEQASKRIFGSDRANLAQLQLITAAGRAANAAMRISDDQAHARLAREVLELNNIVAGGPLIEVAHALEQSRIASGGGVLVKMTTPHSYYAALLRRS